eukprot:CAMPEP_0176376874 /NCGR_PEP_ID=MMETSP0126-20121128/28491_1 /TAXON_ID=141414 ORGANISM="Strombidinopsis acuminatum, Strain SPMC142" /NCGR_SAMPLE_ID=MMETSP0126 /ASSEMBLY_ACC=CAM_ASM_000229 /LENGTH=161 /DNA_ID=CAMNT_0017738481 /DNA_START=26 /DNA_END=511 /DNA_ORIENTATION=+
MQRQAVLNRTNLMTQFNLRYFGVLPKLPKMELTVRTPYKTIFKDFAGFQRLYVRTDKGLMAIGNKSIPRVYLLPPGEMKVHGVQHGEGNFASNDSGVFMHTGGWLFMHDNNSVEVNLLECSEKEQFDFQAINNETTETESAAGKVAADLQEKTFRVFSSRR